MGFVKNTKPAFLPVSVSRSYLEKVVNYCNLHKCVDNFEPFLCLSGMWYKKKHNEWFVTIKFLNHGILDEKFLNSFSYQLIAREEKQYLISHSMILLMKHLTYFLSVTCYGILHMFNDVHLENIKHACYRSYYNNIWGYQLVCSQEIDYFLIRWRNNKE